MTWKRESSISRDKFDMKMNSSTWMISMLLISNSNLYLQKSSCVCLSSDNEKTLFRFDKDELEKVFHRFFIDVRFAESSSLLAFWHESLSHTHLHSTSRMTSIRSFLLFLSTINSSVDIYDISFEDTWDELVESMIQMNQNDWTIDFVSHIKNTNTTDE